MKIAYLLCLCLCAGSLYSQQPSRPNAPNQPGTVGETLAPMSVSETLRYTNDLFDLYNKYDSAVNVDLVTDEMIFADKFSELRGRFSMVEFRRDGENMGMFCKDGSNCLRSRDTKTGEQESPRSKYTFGIKSNGKAVAETDIAISRLNSMLKELSGAVARPGKTSGVISSQLEIINNAFKKYNNYNTVFSVRGDRLHWDSRVANVSGDLNDLTFYINYDNNWMVVKCITGECLEGGINKESYSMGLSTSSGEIAPNIEAVLQAFNILRSEVLRN